MLTIRNFRSFKNYLHIIDYDYLFAISQDISQLEKEQMRLVNKLKEQPHQFLPMSEVNDFGDIRPYEVINKCDFCGEYNRSEICYL